MARGGQLRPDDHLIIDLSGSFAGSLQPLRRVTLGHHRELAYDLPEHLDERFAQWLGWVYGDG